MLRIRASQFREFEAVAMRRFEEEMILHSKEFSPSLCEMLGDEQLRIALDLAMDRAAGYGFSNRGPLRLYIELMFLFGSDFETDPQYPWIQQILLDSADQMQRAEWLYEHLVEYQQKVADADAENILHALWELSVLTQSTVSIPSSDFAAGMRYEIARVVPQKATYVGEEGLSALIDEGRTEAKKHGFSTASGQALIIILMLAFGHGCSNDPLYPWITATLVREKDPVACEKQLKQKTLDWLDQALSWSYEGVQ